MSGNYDYYLILGVSRTASHGEIEEAYHKILHSNNMDDQSLESISKAYKTLSDPKSRNRYDWISRLEMNEIEQKFFESAFERIPDIVPQYEVATSSGDNYRLDFVKLGYPDPLGNPRLKVAIEIDGQEYHKTREQRTHDAEKEQNLRLDGWDFIRFTGTQLYKNADQCVDVAVKLIWKRLDEITKSDQDGSSSLFFGENYKFAKIMADNVISKLNGSNDEFVRLELADNPSKFVVLGTLADSSKDFSIVGERERTASSVKNNSMSIRFLTNNKSGILKVKPSLSIYYRVYPNYLEQKEFSINHEISYNEKIDLAKIWKKLECDFEEGVFSLSDATLTRNLDFDPFLNIIRNDKFCYKSGKDIDLEDMDTTAKFEDKIFSINRGNIPPFSWTGRILLEQEKFIQEDDELYLITVTLINDTKENRKYETFFFNCSLEIDLLEINIIPFSYNYDYEDERYNYKSYLRNLNCHAIFNDKSKKIYTKHYAEFNQKRLVPRIKAGSESFSFFDLASYDSVYHLEKLEGLIAKFSEQYKNSNSYNEDLGYRKKADHFEKIKIRYSEGLDKLKMDKNALKAFILMNKTFKFASKFDNWRIFQLVFIVSLIPDIINKTERREVCDLLHVHTGGGKTEAYLGCVLFSAFYDRIIGKRFGTTAITKFPLRMLSIQQLQRIANLFIWAEDLRIKDNLGGEPFSVAYFVGSTEEFPRFSKSIIRNLEEQKRIGGEVPGKIINSCPICSGAVILDYKDPERYIIHRCKECERIYRLFFTDEEIYRLLPTLIVSTVDKFAGIASNRRYKNIFGGKIDECLNGHGFLPRNDVCDNVALNAKEDCRSKGKPVLIDFKTGPNLIIQDEMHLIREGFGTINSHFESLIETLNYKLSGYKFKNIVMTATTTGSREQIKQLYNKELVIFPGESAEGRGCNDLFFEYEMEGAESTIQRLIFGLKPNLRDNQFASLLTLKYVSEFIKKIERDPFAFSIDNDINIEHLTNIIKNYKIFLTYHNKKSDVYSMNYYLDAVVNSKLDDYIFQAKTLTGDNTLDDIKELIDLINRFFDIPENEKSLLSVFSTSIVSHGIDIDKWNFMIFQGMPRSTAEYIQAMSRVGRKFPGIIFVWAYPNRARDLSYYQNFIDYHNIIEQKVENVPLSRWAKLGFKQTFTSIFNASILNFMSDLLEYPIYKVEIVNQVFSDKEKKDKLIQFIKSAYLTNSAGPYADYFNREIQIETEKRLEYLRSYGGGSISFFPNALRDCEDKYFKTQFGMRGIQDEIILKPLDDDLNIYKKISR
ncbi:MAG: DnaJ domain-containing protein [Methanotrichaceae archaeon]|nr:DnaJ domain-containing protein [Methanotrichaceae archaeon]